MSDSRDNPDPQGLQFPADHEIKVMAESSEDVVELALSVLTGAGALVRRESVRVRASRGGRFQSVSVTVHAESREVLVGYYQALREHPAVRWLL